LNQNLIPLLETAIADPKFLAEMCILIIIKSGTTIIGSCDLPLRDSLTNKGSFTNFDTPIHFYGKIFGSLKGSFMFETAG